MVLTAVDDDHEEHCRPGDCGVSTLHDGERAAALRAASDLTIASSQRALIVAALCSNWNAVAILLKLVFYFEKAVGAAGSPYKYTRLSLQQLWASNLSS